jgi:hypothetical protein
MGAIRALSQSFNAPDRPPLAYCHRHRALLMGKELAIFCVELPSDAPEVLTNTRSAPSESDAGPIVMGDHTCGVGSVNRCRKSIQRLEEIGTSLADCLNGGLYHIVSRPTGYVH